MSVARVEIDKNGTYTEIPNWITLTWDTPPINVQDVPTARLTVPNDKSGRADLKIGQRLRVYRNDELEFDGIVKDKSLSKSNRSQSTVELLAKHRAYDKLDTTICESYDFAEEGATIFGVTVNPWRYTSFRNVEGAITSINDFPIVDGVRADEIFEALIGTKLVITDLLEDTKLFLDSTAVGSTKTLTIYQDKVTSQKRPYLQLTRTGTTSFSTTGNVETIPLMNGDKNIEAMGELKSVTATLWGKRDAAGNNPTLTMCRDASNVVKEQKTSSVTSESITNSGTTRIAQKFNSGSPAPTIQRVLFNVKSLTPTTSVVPKVTVRIETESSGSPSGTLAHANFNVTHFPILGDNVINFTPAALTASTDYWIVITYTATAGSMTFGGATTGTADQAKKFVSGSWSLSANVENLKFAVYSRTYITLGLSTFTANKKESLDEWVYSASFGAGSEASKNELSLKIELTGNGTATTRFAYIKIVAVTNSDIGLSVGNVETYVDTSGTEASGETLRDGADFVEIDLLGKSRLDALDEVRRITVSDAANPNPYWDMWFNAHMDAFFQQRRGEDRSRVYKFEKGDGILTSLDHQTDSTQLYYQVIAYGAGSGEASTRIVSKAEYDSGGLYDSTLDPVGGAKWGDAATIGSFRDSNIKSAVSLLKRARAFFKLHSKPIETYKVQLHPEEITYFYPGDSIRLVDRETETDVVLRVQSLKRAFSATNRETLELEVGEPLESLEHAIGNIGKDLDVQALIPQPVSASHAPIGAGTNCTKDIAGLWTFNVIEGNKIDRVFLSALTVPWHITSKGAASGGASSPTSSSTSIAPVFVQTSTVGPASIADGATSTLTVTMPSGGTNGYWLLCVTSSTLGVLGDWFIDNNTNGDDYFMVQSVKTQLGIGLYIPEDIDGDSLRLRWTNRSGSSVSMEQIVHIHKLESHSHTVSLPNHTHGISFGIWQFDGDSGNGTGTPIYGSGIEIWVDPAESSAGIPDLLDTTKKLPIVFGDRVASTSVTNIDVTGYLENEGAGQIKEGLHRVYIKSAAATSNAQGLAAVQLSTSIKHRETQGNGA